MGIISDITDGIINVLGKNATLAGGSISDEEPSDYNFKDTDLPMTFVSDGAGTYRKVDTSRIAVRRAFHIEIYLTRYVGDVIYNDGLKPRHDMRDLIEEIPMLFFNNPRLENSSHVPVNNIVAVELESDEGTQYGIRGSDTYVGTRLTVYVTYLKPITHGV